jgi:hypothetical protein
MLSGDNVERFPIYHPSDGTGDVTVSQSQSSRSNVSVFKSTIKKLFSFFMKKVLPIFFLKYPNKCSLEAFVVCFSFLVQSNIKLSQTNNNIKRINSFFAHSVFLLFIKKKRRKGHYREAQKSK